MLENLFKRFPITQKMFVLSDQVVVSASAFLTNILLAHQLGLSEYGIFSGITLTQLFILSLQQAGGPGMYQVLYNKLPGRKKTDYTNGLLFLEIIFLIIIIFIAAIAIFFISSDNIYRQILIPAVICIVLYLLQDFLRKMFLTQQRAQLALISDVCTNALQIGALALVWYFKKMTLLNACWIVGITFIPSIIFSLVYLKAKYFIVRDLRVAWKMHKKDSGWMILASLVQWSAGNFFIVAAGWWIGPAALGVFRLAQYLFGLLNVLLQAIENYVLPKAASVQASNEKLFAYLKVVLTKSVLYILPVLLSMTFFAKDILRLAGGQAYTPYAFIIYSLAVLYLIITAFYPIKIVLRVQLLNQDYFLGYLFATLTSLCVAKLFIINWQIGGVLAGLFLSQFITNFYWLYILFKKNFFTWKLSIWS